MTTTYVPLKYAKKAMREVRKESLREGERRGYARATEFVRMASSLNGSTHAVLKALQEEGDGLATPRNRMVPVDGDGAAVDGAPDGDLDAVLMAALDALAEAKTHHPETDGGPVYAYLAGLLADPEALADALAEMDGGEVVGKSFDESKHPRGDNGRFIGREQIHAAKSDPKLADELRAKTTDPEQRKKLEAALKGDVDLGRTKAGEHRERVAKQRQDRQERVKRAQELANDISMWRRGGEAVPASHFRELAEVLPSMTVAELRSVRGKLAASFGGDRRKAEMAARLLEHAKNKAALLETNERNEDMDALDFGSLHEYQNEGNAKGNEARNPNPEEQHGGRMQQRHDLMGAGAKGELNAPGKLSHGTPDTGSVLKLGDKLLPPQEPLSEPRQPTPSPAPSGEGATTVAGPTATVEPEPPPPSQKMRSMGTAGFSPTVGSKVAVLDGTVARGAEIISVSPDGKKVKVRRTSFTPEQRQRMDEAGDPGLYDKVTSPGFVFHPADMGNVNMWMSQHLKSLTGGADAGSFLADSVVVRNDLGKDVTDPQMIRSKPATSATPVSSATIPPDHAAALSSAAKHHTTDKPEGGATVKQPSEEAKKRLDALLAPGNDVDKAREAAKLAEDSFEFMHHIGHFTDGTHDVAITGRGATQSQRDATRQRIAGPFKTEEEARRAFVEARSAAKKPHLDKMRAFEAEREALLKAEADAEDVARPPITFAKPPTQSDVVQGNADVASEKHNQSHNSAESEPVYTSPDPEHVADIARARDADKKFRGEGRYEAEVWQKLRNSNPDKPMPPLSRDAAEWLADGYERDGKPIPDEVLKDNPDLRGQYQKTAAPAASDTPMSPAVHDAVKSAVKHHKRMQMPGKPVPQMVVYHIPEHRNTGGQLIEPAKVNAVPVNSYTGEQLLSGKLPHLKIEGTFEVGADGTPKRVEGADFTKSINDAITSTPSTHGDARFIHHVYDAMRQKNPSLTRDEFNRQLIDAHKRRDITLSRLDMPQGHATADIQAARVPHMNAEFHFVEPNGKRATQTKAIPSDWDDLRAELAVRRGIVHDDGATGV